MRNINNLEYKISGVTSAAGITFVGFKSKVIIKKESNDTATNFKILKYNNPSASKTGKKFNVPFLRGFFKLFNAFKMVSGTLIGKIAIGFLAFGFTGLFLSLIFPPLTVTNGGATSGAVITETAKQTSDLIVASINFIMLFGIIGYVWFIRHLHGLEHKIIETFNKGLELTVNNVKSQPKESPSCGGTFLGIILFIDLIWLVGLGLPSSWLWLIWPSLGFEMFLLARGTKWYNKIMFMPGWIVQQLTTGNKITDDEIEHYLIGFREFIKHETTNEETASGVKK